MQCSFTFVTQKKSLRTARKRHSLLVQSDSALSTVMDDGNDPIKTLMARDPLEIPLTSIDEEMGNYMYVNNVGESFVDPGLSSYDGTLQYLASTELEYAPLDLEGFDSRIGLSDSVINEILFTEPSHNSDATTPSLSFGHSSRADTIEELSRSASNVDMPWATGNPCSVTSNRSISGLEWSHEAAILQDFAELVYPQLPVLDMDMVVLRYRFSLPTPLPRYLLLTIIACGATYSAQKSVPGIDRASAIGIFELAKEEILLTALDELSIDAISAMGLISFHWQGDLSESERSKLFDLSVQKIQTMGLHTEVGLTTNRSAREIGILRYIVWLNYIVDAFSAVVGPLENDLEIPKMLYNGLEIMIRTLDVDDFNAITGIENNYTLKFKLTDDRGQRALLFHRSFASLAKIQHRVTARQRARHSLRPMVDELSQWTLRSFPALDLLLHKWDRATAMYIGTEGMSSAIISLNFSYWYCTLNLHFNLLKEQLQPVVDQTKRATLASPGLDDASIGGCCRAFTALISIFEDLATGSRLYQTSQTLRGQLYFAGRVLQLFYKNKVRQAGLIVVGPQLLQRWEKCLEISELIWGYSVHGVDLSRMSLEELE